MFRTRAILIVFDKLTRACFSQIALETILLPVQVHSKHVWMKVQLRSQHSVVVCHTRFIVFVRVYLGNKQNNLL